MFGENSTNPQFGRGSRPPASQGNEVSHGYGRGGGRPDRDRSANWGGYNQDRRAGDRSYGDGGGGRGFRPNDGGYRREQQDRSPYQRERSSNFGGYNENNQRESQRDVSSNRQEDPRQRSRTPDRQYNNRQRYAPPQAQQVFDDNEHDQVQNDAPLNMKHFMQDHYLQLILCDKCGSQYLVGSAHNCYAMILSIHLEVQRVLLRREKHLKDLTQKHRDLDQKYRALKDHLSKAHISGLITHYERLPLYCMSPEDENEVLIKRLAEIQTPQYRAGYIKHLRENPTQQQFYSQKDQQMEILKELQNQILQMQISGAQNPNIPQQQPAYNPFTDRPQMPAPQQQFPPHQPQYQQQQNPPQSAPYQQHQPYQPNVFQQQQQPPPYQSMQSQYPPIYDQQPYPQQYPSASPYPLSSYSEPYTPPQQPTYPDPLASFPSFASAVQQLPTPMTPQQQRQPIHSTFQQQPLTTDNLKFFNQQSALNDSKDSIQTIQQSDEKIKSIVWRAFQKKKDIVYAQSQPPHGYNEEQKKQFFSNLRSQHIISTLLNIVDTNEKTAQAQRLPNPYHQFSLFELKSIKPYRNETKEVIRGDIQALQDIVIQRQGLGSIYLDSTPGSFYIKAMLIFDAGRTLTNTKIQGQDLKEKFNVFFPKIATLSINCNKHWIKKDQTEFIFVFDD